MSIAALTTIFTPAPSCLADFWQGVWDWYGPFQIENDCFPENFVADTSSYYSPGRCPSGYAPINTLVNTIAGSITETTQTCCPTTIDFSPQPTPTRPFPLCISYYTSSGTVLMTSLGDDRKRTTRIATTSEGGNVNAWGVIIRFQSTDFVSATSTASFTASTLTPPPGSATPSPIPASTAAAAPPSPSLPPQSSGSLSSGAKVGIGVGVTAAVLALALAVAVGYIVGHRRKQTADEVAQVGQQCYPYYATWHNLDVRQEEQWNPSEGRHELGSSDMGELDAETLR